MRRLISFSLLWLLAATVPADARYMQCTVWLAWSCAPWRGTIVDVRTTICVLTPLCRLSVGLSEYQLQSGDHKGASSRCGRWRAVAVCMPSMPIGLPPGGPGGPGLEAAPNASPPFLFCVRSGHARTQTAS